MCIRDRIDFGEPFFYGVSTLSASDDDFDSHDGDVGTESANEFFFVIRRDHDDDLLDVFSFQEKLSRIKPDRFVVEINKWLFKVGIVKPAAFTCCSEDD